MTEFSYRQTNRDFYNLQLEFVCSSNASWTETVQLNRNNFADLYTFDVTRSISQSKCLTLYPAITPRRIALCRLLLTGQIHQYLPKHISFNNRRCLASEGQVNLTRIGHAKSVRQHHAPDVVHYSSASQYVCSRIESCIV